MPENQRTRRNEQKGDGSKTQANSLPLNVDVERIQNKHHVSMDYDKKGNTR